MNREEAEAQIEETLAKTSDPKLTEDERVDLHKKALNDYSQALAQEFEEQLSDKAAEKNAPEFTKAFFREHLGFAAAGIVQLASNSTSDAVRAACCRDIIKYAIGDAVATGDPWADLLKDIAKKPSAHAPGELVEVKAVNESGE